MIIGGGDLGQLIAHHALDSNYKVVGFIDDTKEIGDSINNIPVLGNITDIETLFNAHAFDECIVAIGYKHFSARKTIYEKCKQIAPMAKIIHSSCYIDSSVKISPGTVILPGCVLDRNVAIGENVLLNIAVTVAHDSKINNHSFLSPRVAIAGFSIVGECCMVGINSTIIDNISICDNVLIGGGAIIVKNIEQSGLYVGNPARCIR